MRLWTLHPRYLDRQGLLALWREGLLAQAVLRGKTKGYRHHPQLNRFRQQQDPVAAIATYLASVQSEAARRGYDFNARKIGERRMRTRITETDGQIKYEWQHLRAKLAKRSPALLSTYETVRQPQAHPLFRLIPGGIRDWEGAAASVPGKARRPDSGRYTRNADASQVLPRLRIRLDDREVADHGAPH